MPAVPFVHLHLHSEYSLADSTIRIDELVKRCASLSQPAVALTDLDNLFALVKFYKAAEGAGIKPIVGADIGLADGNENAARMTLLCRDRTGYLTLSRLLTRAWMEGHRTDGVALRPRMAARATTPACSRSPAATASAGRLATGNRHELAERLARWTGAACFGERLHLELTRTAAAKARTRSTPSRCMLARRARCPSSPPTTCASSTRDDFDAHEARVCIATGRVLDDPKRPQATTAPSST